MSEFGIIHKLLLREPFYKTGKTLKLVADAEIFWEDLCVQQRYSFEQELGEIIKSETSGFGRPFDAGNQRVVKTEGNLTPMMGYNSIHTCFFSAKIAKDVNKSNKC